MLVDTYPPAMVLKCRIGFFSEVVWGSGSQIGRAAYLFEHELLLERDFSGSLMIDFGLPLLEPRSFDLPLCRFPLAVAQLLSIKTSK